MCCLSFSGLFRAELGMELAEVQISQAWKKAIAASVIVRSCDIDRGEVR